MRQVSLDLSKFEGVEGKIIVSVPLYRQRLQYVKDLGLKVDAEGSVTTSESDGIDTLLKMLPMIEKHVIEVDIKKGNITAKSLNDLESYAEFDGLVSGLIDGVMNAGKLGN